MFVAHEADKNIDLATSDEGLKECVSDVYGDEGKNPGDFLFLFEKPDELLTEDEKVKKATFTAYNEVGKTAHIEGNVQKAKAIMKYLGYSDEEFQIAGKDSYNYQGVGNPHQFAKIQPGEHVLDLGSGLGVDSFISCHYAGKEGKVYGLDISKNEVKHAEARAKERGLDI